MRLALDSEQDDFVEAFADVLDRAATPAKVRRWLDDADPGEFEQLLAKPLACGNGQIGSSGILGMP